MASEKPPASEISLVTRTPAGTCGSAALAPAHAPRQSSCRWEEHFISRDLGSHRLEGAGCPCSSPRPPVEAVTKSPMTPPGGPFSDHISSSWSCHALPLPPPSSLPHPTLWWDLKWSHLPWDAEVPSGAPARRIIEEEGTWLCPASWGLLTGKPTSSPDALTVAVRVMPAPPKPPRADVRTQCYDQWEREHVRIP